MNEQERAREPVRWWLVLCLAPVYLMLPVVAALAFRVLGLEAFEAEGPSMEPTLLDGDRFVIDKSAFGVFLPLMSEAVHTWGEPHAGDVVVLRTADDFDVIKRVIGTPGDRIEIRDDVVWRNGAEIQRRVLGPCRAAETSGEADDCEVIEEGIGEERWRTSHSLLTVPESYEEMLVPPGHVFVLGDHRDRSNDSRNPRIGMVPIDRIKGRALFVYWSAAEDSAARMDRVGTGVR